MSFSFFCILSLFLIYHFYFEYLSTISLSLYRACRWSPFYRPNDLRKTPLQGAPDEATSHYRLLLYEPSLIYVYWDTQLLPS